MKKVNILKRFCLFSIACLFSMWGMAQQITVQGTIVDETNSPLTGATVSEIGTTNGVATDIDGKYELKVKSNSNLKIRYVGYLSQEIHVKGQSLINIKLLPDDKLTLEEVVVVGYGVQKKETLSGAVAQLKGDDILKTKSPSLVSGIQGKIPGVQIRQQTGEPGAFNSLVSIRGFGAPIVVIDGVARDGMSDFERLNPEDIESVSILKDASAAIFGINSENGVIIVTTKKGTQGKAKVNYSGYFGFKQPTNTQNSVDAYTYRLMRNEMQRNVGAGQYYSDQEMEKWKVGTDPGYQDYNWLDMMLKKTTSHQQHNISVSGGSEKIKYYISLGYLGDNGLLKSNIQNYDKYTARASVTAEITKGLETEVSFAGKFDQNKSPRIGYFWLYKPIITADRGIGPFTIKNSNHLANQPGTNQNPYAMASEELDGYSKWDNTQYQTTLSLTYAIPFVKGLKLKTLGAYDGNINNNSVLRKGYYLYDNITDEVKQKPATPFYSNNVDQFYRMDFQAQALYNAVINKDHTLGATLVWEAKKTNMRTLGAMRQYDDIYTHDIIDQGSLTGLTNSGKRSSQAFLSLLGRVNYDFKSKYLFEAAFRYDGSYRYAPEKKWVLIPSFSAGWRVSEEKFIKDNLSFITNLKLRGSYGVTASDAGAEFEYYYGYKSSGIDGGYVFNDGVLTGGMIAPGVINHNLTWVKSKTANIGVDLDLWNGKLGLAFDLFQRKRTGIPAKRNTSVPNTFGASFPDENINSELNKGIEFMISHRNKIGEVEYGVSANMVYSRRKLLHVERAPYGSSMEKWKDAWGSNRYQGREWGYEYNGQYTHISQYETAPLIGGTNGNSMGLPGSTIIRDANGDGVINGNDQLPIFWAGQYQGYKNNPPLQYGFNMDMSYKNFDFNMLLQGSALFTVFTKMDDVWGYGRNPVLWERYMDRWHTADPNADPRDPNTEWIPGNWPALRTSAAGTTDALITNKWRHNAAYLRLKSVELGYTIPKKVVGKWGIDNVRVYFNAFNLLTFANKDVKLFDPEKEEGDYVVDLTYPLMKSYNFGVNINF